MNKLMRVAKHEFLVTAANKAFVVITIIGPLLLGAVTILPGLLASDPRTMQGKARIAVVGGDENFRNALSSSLADRHIDLVDEADLASAKEAVASGGATGALVVPPDWTNAKTFRFYSRTGTEIVTIDALRDAIGGLVVPDRLKSAGLDPVLVGELTARPDLEIARLDAVTGEKAPESAFLAALFTGISFTMLIYMTVLLYGQMIGRSVVMEKTSKTVEIMLSSVTPGDLMFGKILGMGCAGLLQYAIWIAVGALVIGVIGPVAKLPVPATLTVGNLIFLAFAFIGAFFLYSSAYAAIGSAADDEHHLGQLSYPLILCLMLPLLFISPIIMNPSSGFALFLSFFPMTSPIVMLLRIMIEPPPAWEIALSAAILVATIAVMVKLAAKIFRVGILMSGKRFSLGEIVRWARY